MQQMHPRKAVLALIGLFQEGESVADFQEGYFFEGGADPFASLINELEFLMLGNDYANDIDGIVDVTHGDCGCIRLQSLVPILNLGERLVVLKHLFDVFEENISWEEDDEDDDDASGTVAQSDSSQDQFSDGHTLADEEEVHKRQLSQPFLFISLLVKS